MIDIDVASEPLRATPMAAVHGFAVATRDAAPSIAAGVTMIDPWAA